MKNSFFKIMDVITKDCYQYKYDNNLWLINPKTKEWVVSYYPKTKYLWWNYHFFKTVHSHLCVYSYQKDLIKLWTQSKLNVVVGENVHPDIIPYLYDWSSEFKPQIVIEQGKIITF
jgi:hypothetical protein